MTRGRRSRLGVTAWPGRRVTTSPPVPAPNQGRDMRTTKKSVVVAGMAIAGLALGACGGGSGAGSAGGAGSTGGSGQDVKTIKLVAAEYSKDHTKAFWDAFAKTYKEKTGYTL